MRLAIIPARAGSKGIPNKNIKELCGLPLIGWTIRAAKESGIFDEILVSTDSPEYAAIAEALGASVPFLRSEELSDDRASSYDVIVDILGRLPEVSEFALLQPTSPLRTASDILGAFELFQTKQADAVVSVSPSAPLKLINSLPEDHNLKGFLREGKNRRQDLAEAYQLNGAIYLARRASFLMNRTFYTDNSFAFVMLRSHSIDIDDRDDWFMAEAILGAR